MRKLMAGQRLWRVAGALGSLFLATAAQAEDQPRVIAVNYPLQYFAERLLGDTAQVEFPVPEGVDPSFWRPSISDISAIQSADLILLNGAAFATWVDRVSLPRSKVVNTSDWFADQYITTESITHSHGDGGEHSHEGTASYTWLDPSLAILQAEAIATAAIARGLASSEEVEDELEALRNDLETLDAETRRALSGLEDMVFIATHPRYQYFARAYDLTIEALEWEAGAAPTGEQLSELGALVEETGARVLIWEADPGAEALSATADLGLQNAVLPPLAHRTGPGGYMDTLAAAITGLARAVPPRD